MGKIGSWYMKKKLARDISDSWYMQGYTKFYNKIKYISALKLFEY
jgi:hypothetical protein